jgi:hypothetical protein
LEGAGSGVLVFRQELRALKIDTPGFAKINVYCEEHLRDYSKQVFDNVTAVEVKIEWDKIKNLKGIDICKVFLDLLTSGTKIVLSSFNISTREIDEIAYRIAQSRFELSIPLGKKAIKNKDGSLAARLRVTNGKEFECCDIVADVFQKKVYIGHVLVCTTFPSPDIAIERFQSLEWDNDYHLLAKFRTPYGIGKKLFGRENFDCSGLEGVSRVDHTVAVTPFHIVERTFKIDISSLLKKN